MILVDVRQRVSDLDHGYALLPRSINHPVIVFGARPSDRERGHVIKESRRKYKEIHTMMRIQLALAPNSLRQVFEPCWLLGRNGIFQVKIPAARNDQGTAFLSDHSV